MIHQTMNNAVHFNCISLKLCEFSNGLCTVNISLTFNHLVTHLLLILRINGITISVIS